MDLAIRSETFGPDSSQGFIVKPSDITEVGCTLDLALFDLSTSDTSIPAGTPLGKVTASGKYGPYSGGANRTDEVVTLTEGGSGLTSWTATFGGQTTTSLDDDATAAQVEAALEALSTIGEGNVSVTGDGIATGLTVTFQGDLADTNVGNITTTPTGGTGTVVVAVTTAGGTEGSSDGREVFAGLLFDSIPTHGKVTGSVGASRIVLGAIYEAKLPTPIDSAAKADLTTIAFV
jgi:hypothetical protein